MYKLTVVSGPNVGTSFTLKNGETTIGRQADNGIVLSSAKVSKRHAVISANGPEIIVWDAGSSNGTFVNGVLCKSRQLKMGDRVSIGDYVLELSQARPSPVLGIVPPPVLDPVAAPASAANYQDAVIAAPAAPRDLKGKIRLAFEKYVMPFFYGLGLKYEWRWVAAGLFSVFILVNLLISVQPLLESGRASAVKEVGRRARFMARQIVERNSGFLAAGASTKTEIGSLEREDGVRMALLMDLENRILAPASRLNQHLTSGSEATLAIKARNAFRKGRESGVVSEVDSSTIVAIEPVKILNPQIGRNVVVGMALVSLDTTLSAPGAGELGVVYSQVLILTGLVGVLILLILYKLTLKPFQILNDDIDKVLKGEMAQVTHEFKMEELNSLWDVMNSALQRAIRGSSAGGGASDSGAEGATPEDYAAVARALGEVSGYGLVACDGDRNVLFMNPAFEEISGIRADSALGQAISAVARDQAFGALVQDLFDRAAPGGASLSEDFEFSGIPYRLHAWALGGYVGSAKCFLLAATRSES